MPHVCSLCDIFVERRCAREHGAGMGTLEMVSGKASLRKWHLKLRPEKSGGKEPGGTDRKSQGQKLSERGGGRLR